MFGVNIIIIVEIVTTVIILKIVPILAPSLTRLYFLAPIFCPVNVVVAMAILITGSIANPSILA